jgi:hypothetical protein
MRRSILAGALVVFVGGRAAAQSSPEIGGGLAFADLVNGGDFWGEGLQHVGAAIHATLPFSQRFALEVSTTLGRRALYPSRYGGAIVEGGDVHRTEGLFAIVVRQRLSSTRPGLHAFATYGLAGFFGTTSSGAIRETYPNGRVYSYPASTYSRTVGPGFPIVGGGFQKELTPHLALRADAQVLFFLFIPAGFRTSASMVVPIGRFRTSRTRQ